MTIASERMSREKMAPLPMASLWRAMVTGIGVILIISRRSNLVFEPPWNQSSYLGAA